jgi:anti-sigma regulatory factor (Ser/Thr protein kinase)
MDRYYFKQQWKFWLIAFAFSIGTLSVLYTNFVVNKIKIDEQKRAKLWSEALKYEFSTDDGEFLNFLSDILEEHTQVPAIMTDESGVMVTSKGLDSTKTFNAREKGKLYDPDYFQEQLLDMKKKNPPLIVSAGPNQKRFIYYKDSLILTELRIFPYVQLGIIFIFLVVSYFTFSRSRRTEQNLVWVGMAKETAHQLGTPISALYAWMDYLREKYPQENVLAEVDEDIGRLQMITDRFSKIGSTPVLEPQELIPVIEKYIHYFEIRASRKIKFEVLGQNEVAMLNIPLFEWVIENLCKNAINAMGSVGKVTITVTPIRKGKVQVDFKDTGKGIPKLRWETIFQPGYTTRKRGWGLGLSLSRRIIENYHRGEIYVKESEIGKGTTFRIILKGAGSLKPIKKVPEPIAEGLLEQNS